MVFYLPFFKLENILSGLLLFKIIEIGFFYKVISLKTGFK